MKVTIGIKAFNEERHIQASLLSALNALRGLEGEVILADSGSTDRTVEIAREFPVRIFQIADPEERCCGAGAQLAFQHNSSDYFYLLDGDMTLEEGFLREGLAYLASDQSIAGVGGRVREMHVTNQEFAIRSQALGLNRHWSPGFVDRLDCGGLYRVSAIRDVGYFADRNLHAFEEFELAARLRSRGWRLARIDTPAVCHFGHTTGGSKLLWRRLRSGYAAAPGEVLRSAIGRPQLPIVLSRLSHIRYGFIVLLWWLMLGFGLLFDWAFFLALLLSPLAFLSLRRKSFSLGVYSFAVWNVAALGLILGLLRTRKSPDDLIASVRIDQQVGFAKDEPPAGSLQGEHRTPGDALVANQVARSPAS